EYSSLALVVTDEQHRFGVRQRETLAAKGKEPHVLVMSATPIPRTLAIILYGDLKVSVVDELPANRLPIKNCVVDTGYRNTAYNFMKKQIAEGRQCYVICPMVEESETMEAENVTDYTVALQEEMGEQIQVACLHGKMKQAQKDDIMDRFGRNEIQILVSTTVIEVGIDVPNATVMMIENAERFGLAQLHQLRGRVGRGGGAAACVLLFDGNLSETGKERLKIIRESNDGFEIARRDLELRGPGEFLGEQQSGMPMLQFADLDSDAELVETASRTADLMLKQYPEQAARHAARWFSAKAELLKA
ncbi:MAG TPA: ATP-dependent DNA helicase RecG, partial [Sutterella wadsworthensis]|nr:ATP-dependent DNA helicase RecG [Sutterella wadsworthensis]